MYKKFKHFIDFKDAKRQFDLLVYPDKKTTIGTFFWIVAVMFVLMTTVSFIIDPLSISLVKVIATGSL